MSIRRSLYLSLACVALSQVLHGQEQNPAALKEGCYSYRVSLSACFPFPLSSRNNSHQHEVQW
jgi:hypothetical protein